MGPGLAPLYLRFHRVHSFELGRCLVGAELLRTLGFPRDFERSGLSASHLVQLAGNTLSVHVHSALIAVMLIVSDTLGARGQDVDSSNRSVGGGPRATEGPIWEVPPHLYTIPECLAKIELPGVSRIGKVLPPQDLVRPVAYAPPAIRWNRADVGCGAE